MARKNPLKQARATLNGEQKAIEAMRKVPRARTKDKAAACYACRRSFDGETVERCPGTDACCACVRAAEEVVP